MLLVASDIAMARRSEQLKTVLSLGMSLEKLI